VIQYPQKSPAAAFRFQNSYTVDVLRFFQAWPPNPAINDLPRSPGTSARAARYGCKTATAKILVPHELSTFVPR
jgi:hypothetical protein